MYTTVITNEINKSMIEETNFGLGTFTFKMNNIPTIPIIILIKGIKMFSLIK